MPPVIGPLNITPPRGVEKPSTTPVVQAFEAGVAAEESRVSPLESFTKGANLVEDFVQNKQQTALNTQQARLNELQTKRRENQLLVEEMDTKRKIEEAEKDRIYIQSINTGNTSKQLNSVLAVDPNTRLRNKEATTSVLSRIMDNGSAAEKEEARDLLRTVNPSLVLDDLKSKRDHEEAEELVRTRERARTAREKAKARRESTDPLKRRELKLKERKADIEDRKTTIQEKKLRGGNVPQVTRELDFIENMLATEPADELGEETPSENLAKKLRTRRKDISDASKQSGIPNAAAEKSLRDEAISRLTTEQRKRLNDFSDLQSSGAPTLPTIRFDEGRLRSRSAAPTLGPQRNVGTRIKPGETAVQAGQRVINSLKLTASTENRVPTSQEIEEAVDALIELSIEAGKKPDRERIKAFVLQQLQDLGGR